MKKKITKKELNKLYKKPISQANQFERLLALMNYGLQRLQSLKDVGIK